MTGGKVGFYLDRITGRDSVDRVLEQARGDGVDLGELERAAADLIGVTARKVNGPGGHGQGNLDRAAGLRLLLDRVGALESRSDDEEQFLRRITLLVQAARDGDGELIGEISTILAISKDVPRALGVLLANIHRTCPDDARRPDGRPNMAELSGTRDRERFVERATSAGKSEKDARALWERGRAAAQLLDSALTALKHRGDQAETLTTLRKGLAADPALAAPSVRTAAETAALCLTVLDDGGGPKHWRLDTENFAPQEDPSKSVLPPSPLPADLRFDDDPAHPIDYAQPVASRVPRWRNQMLRHFAARETAVGLTEGIHRMSLVPAVASRLTAAQIIIGQEARRLERGRVYHLNTRLTQLATEQRFEPRKLPITWARIPTTTGFMAFERPIAGTQDQPITAVSWGPWTAGWDPHPDGRPRKETAVLDRPVWLHQDPHTNPQHCRDYFDGTLTGRDHAGEERVAGLLTPGRHDWLWVTFYNAYPDRGIPLAWRAEMVVPIGSRLSSDGPDAGSRLSWLRALLAAWDRLTDPEYRPGNVAAVVEELVVVRPDNRARTRKGKKTAPPRADIVHVVTDHYIPLHRNSEGRAREQKTAIPAQRPDPRYGLVVQTKGTQNHCFAPRGEHRRLVEAGESCPHHREIPLAAEYRKHADLPLRPNQTVHRPQ